MNAETTEQLRQCCEELRRALARERERNAKLHRLARRAFAEGWINSEELLELTSRVDEG